MTYFVVMGVAGCGKSTIAAALAARLGCVFAEGDLLHPPENLAKMTAGAPLTDADRAPWLRLIAARLASWRAAGIPGVITCSALKRRYRALIVAGHTDIRFVYLRGSREVVAARLGTRRGHFMPASMLESQFADLEEPAPPEPVIVVDVALPPPQVVAAVLAAIDADHSLRAARSRM